MRKTIGWQVDGPTATLRRTPLKRRDLRPDDLGPYLRLVAMDGTLVHLGHLGPVTVETMDLLVGRKKLSSAGSGGTPATAAMLDFCAEHGITADYELLPSGRVDEALDRLRHNDVRYRFVLDMSDLD